MGAIKKRAIYILIVLVSMLCLFSIVQAIKATKYIMDQKHQQQAGSKQNIGNENPISVNAMSIIIR